MLNTIDTLFNRGFGIVDVGISRIVGVRGKEPKINGSYPSISKSVKIVEGCPSSTWLLCKWNQLNNTNFNSLEQVKALFEGMHNIKEGEIEYHNFEDLYTMVVFTYTKSATGAITKERVKLWLTSALPETVAKPQKTESKEKTSEAIIEIASSDDDLVL